ncbi:MAG: hypothetical protein N2039_06795, partial [Gemmataceae bacterium]|nr:hypothetical protein [Gemmataceae bacterium]
MPFVWGAFLFAGLVLPATYLPGGRLLALLLSLIGWALGAVAFLGRLKTMAWPIIATGVNLTLMLAVMLLPTWLGLGPWLPTFGSSDVDDRTVHLVPFQGKGSVATSDGWIDANLGGWQRGDLR